MALIARNEVDPDDLVSVIFTATSDLDAEFPAAAARHLGLAHVPLLCSVEVDVPGALARCIRVLIHLYSAREPHELQHVYLRGARGLRLDLETGAGQGVVPVGRADPNARTGGALPADEERIPTARLPADGKSPPTTDLPAEEKSIPTVGLPADGESPPTTDLPAHGENPNPQGDV